ncbi:MAG: DEAD/DEAH box helicase family protein [bacterium]
MADAESMAAGGTAEIAVPVPVEGAFHYRVPVALEAVARPGCRVRVRFGGRLVVGYLLARDTPPPTGVRLSSLEAVLDDDLPTFDEALLAFVRWMATYYHAPVGEVLRGAHPPGTNEQTAPAWVLTDAGRAAPADASPRALLAALAAGPVPQDDLPAEAREAVDAALAAGLVRATTAAVAAPVQVKHERVIRAVAPAPTRPRGPGGRPLKRDVILAWLVGRGAVPARDIADEFPSPSAHIRQLMEEGSVVEEEVEVLRDPVLGAAVPRDTPPTLTPAQRRAVDALTAPRAYAGFLLQGVTGSGKTEVYLHAIEAVLARGDGALVLVPEIALTPQLVRRFRARLGDAIAVLHSGLSRGERFDAWRRLRRGDVRLAIGARSPPSPRSRGWP